MNRHPKRPQKPRQTDAARGEAFRLAYGAKDRKEPAQTLLGGSAPASLQEFVTRSLELCIGTGQSVDVCNAQALALARNLGWERAGDGWRKGPQRNLTFVEQVDPKTGKSPTFHSREVQLLEEGLFPINTGPDGKPVYHTFTRAEIEAMAGGTNEIFDRLKPTVTRGHISDEEARKRPADGHVQQLFTKPNPKTGKLGVWTRAFVGMPADTAAMVETGGFGRISIDGEFNYLDPSSGKKYPLILKRVSLQGGNKPRVDTMDEDGLRMYREPDPDFEQKIAAGDSTVGFTVAFASAEGNGEGERDMTKQEIEALIAENNKTVIDAAVKKAVADAVAAGKTKGDASAEPKGDAETVAALTTLTSGVAGVQAENTELKKQLATLNALIAKGQNDAADAEDDRFIDEMVGAGVVTAAQKPHLKLALAEGRKSAPVAIKLADGKDGTGTNADALKELLRGQKAAGMRAFTPGPQATVKVSLGEGKDVELPASEIEAAKALGIDPTKLAHMKQVEASGKAPYSTGQGF